MQLAGIAAFYASIYALFYLYLGIRVVILRRKLRQDIGSGSDPQLARAIRTHQNACEYVPYTFLLLLCFELAGGSVWLLHTLGILVLIARLMHFIGFGFKIGISFGRVWGTTLNYLVIIMLSILNMWVFSQNLLTK